MHEKEVSYQLVPPYCKRANAAERAIQTFKAHSKSGLALLDPEFPVREWDRLLQQAELTLNLLRFSKVNPRLSAQAYLFGMFDYNKTPLVPPGMKVIAHTKPEVRKSWEFNGKIGFVVGPAFEHYRCLMCYFPETRSTRPVDTVTFFPSSIPVPEVKLEDFLRQAAIDIVTILQDPPSTKALKLQVGNEMRNTLLDIASILKRCD